MRSGGGVAKAKSLIEWEDTEGTCFIDSRMPREDSQLKWALEDGETGQEDE